VKARGIGILGLGVYLPERVRTNSEWPPDFAEESRRRFESSITSQNLPAPSADMPETVRIAFEELAKSAGDPFRGSRERRVAAADQQSSDMEVPAARDAIADAGLRPRDIGLLLSYTGLPDLISPANSSLIHRKLHLPTDAPAMSVDGACGSFMFQLQLAGAFLLSGAAKYALLVQSALSSRVLDMLDPQSPTFGDAATAVVLGPVSEDKGILSARSFTNGRFYKSVVLGPASEDGRWYSGADGSVRVTSYDFKSVQETLPSIGRMARESLDIAMEEAHVSRSEIDFFATHQTIQEFNPICRRAAGLEHARTMDTYQTIGSVIGCSIPVNLYFGRKEGLLKDNDLVALFTTGAGLNWSAGILRWGR
jgi:3-oxoacyl-[acyl-carrier-protein] synthase III